MLEIELSSLKHANKELGKISLSNEIFSHKINHVLLKNVIDWQLAKARSGTHKARNISEVSGTGKKPHAQKGSGRARQGSLRSVHMRGGAVAHAIRCRQYGKNGPTKKQKKLALLQSISGKFADKKIIVLDDFIMEKISTKTCASFLKSLSVKSALIYVNTGDNNFKLSVRNIPNIKIIESKGLNTYDLVKHEYFITSKDLLNSLEDILLVKKEKVNK